MNNLIPIRNEQHLSAFTPISLRRYASIGPLGSVQKFHFPNSPPAGQTADELVDEYNAGSSISFSKEIPENNQNSQLAHLTLLKQNSSPIASVGENIVSNLNKISNNLPPIIPKKESNERNLKYLPSDRIERYLLKNADAPLNSQIIIQQNTSEFLSSFNSQKLVDSANPFYLKTLKILNDCSSGSINLPVQLYPNSQISNKNMLNLKEKNKLILNSSEKTIIIDENSTKIRKKKKPYKELTLEEKVELIRLAESHSNMSQASIAERYTIAKSNVCRILQRKEEYLNAYESAGYAASRKRKIRSVPEKYITLVAEDNKEKSKSFKRAKSLEEYDEDCETKNKNLGSQSLRAHMLKQHPISHLLICHCCNIYFVDKPSLHAHIIQKKQQARQEALLEQPTNEFSSKFRSNYQSENSLSSVKNISENDKQIYSFLNMENKILNTDNQNLKDTINSVLKIPTTISNLENSLNNVSVFNNSLLKTQWIKPDPMHFETNFNLQDRLFLQNFLNQASEIPKDILSEKINENLFKPKEIHALEQTKAKDKESDYSEIINVNVDSDDGDEIEINNKNYTLPESSIVQPIRMSGVIQGVSQGIVSSIDYIPQITHNNTVLDDDSRVVSSRASSSNMSPNIILQVNNNGTLEEMSNNNNNSYKNKCMDCSILKNRLQAALAQTNFLQLYNISLQNQLLQSDNKLVLSEHNIQKMKREINMAKETQKMLQNKLMECRQKTLYYCQIEGIDKEICDSLTYPSIERNINNLTNNCHLLTDFAKNILEITTNI